jgi:hypothetical protein
VVFVRLRARKARATLEAFRSSRDSVALPQQLLQFKPSTKYQYQASMQITVRISVLPFYEDTGLGVSVYHSC